MSEPFRDPARPVAERVADLVARLTVDEKIALLHQYQAPVDRLGLEPFRTGTEALHGLAWLGPATVFPQAVGLASTWNPELVRRVGAATADEVVAFHRKDRSGAGRNVWAPVVNPLRDPRWGRNEEGYSEDPWLTGVMGTAYASGLKGDGRVMKTAPTLKHFLAYNNETDRCATSSNLPPRVLHEYELRAFRAPIEAGAAVAVMPSYNLVNGRPAHLSPLINDVLRTWARDDLLVVSDAYAPANLFGVQAYYDDPAEAYAHALKAGLDSFTQDDADPAATLGHVREALRRGLIDESDVDTAVRHALSIRVRLGEFDPNEPFLEITEAVVNRPEHQRLAREAATESMTLLKNDGLLPLAAATKVAVVGPLSDVLLEDWYSGTLPYQVTARAGLAGRTEVLWCEGVDRIVLRAEEGYVSASAETTGGPLTTGPSAEFDLFDWGGGAVALRSVPNGRHVGVGDDGVLVNDQPGPSGWEVRQTFRMEDRFRGVVLRHIFTGRYVGISDGVLGLADDPENAAVFVVETVESGAGRVARLAAEADVAVVVLGDHPLVNGRETEDRADLALPRLQEDLLRAVHAANPRTVLVVSSGYPFALNWAQEHVPAILWSSHGGQEYGHALADVVFGDADPGGRLTQTWYRSACELPDLLDYDIITTDATYLYFRGSPLYPFGHGLSYTTFGYSDLTAVPGEETLRLEVTIANTGARPGVEVVQFYTHQCRSRVKQPVRSLRGFVKVRLAPGESRRVGVTVPLRDLAFWDVTRDRFVVEDAPCKAQAGPSSGAIRVCARFHLPGETVPPRDPSLLDAAACDEYDGMTLCEAARDRGDAVRSAEPGAWVRFRDVALAGETTAVVTAAGDEGGMVTLRLGDPLGEIAATLAVPRTTSRFDPVETRAHLSPVTGVRDVYLVCENEGVTVTTLRFHA
ncbi:carbohydrate-binding protein [Herbidospora sp. NEAU-GS84]|uniref:Carbohydrate-binding protein n=1 Tax=Herbidospora solisilvae TaxID=2696284 RepID=A0A7C9JRR1_9ACTN|nr:glycoside hydrolase family 3 protein [Herbidospora solisilvae]NAS21359.1 carbohydrate-binding protein [Herbidospora solisilvae]